MPTVEGITYAEISTRISIKERGVEAVRQFKVDGAFDPGTATPPPWLEFARKLMGLYSFDNKGVSSQSVAPIPLPGFPNCFCRDVDVEPWMPDSPDGDAVAADDLLKTKVTNWEDSGGAKVTARYSTDFMAYRLDAHPDASTNSVGNEFPVGTYLSYEEDFGGEIMTLSDNTMVWTGATEEYVDSGVNPGIVIPTSQLKIEWFWILDPPWEKIRKRVGTINDTQFFGAPVGTVLFLGCQPVPVMRVQKDTATLYRLIYRFARQSKLLADGTTTVGWNYFYKSAGDAVAGERWVQIQDASANKPYKTSDFTQLFTYAN